MTSSRRNCRFSVPALALVLALVGCSGYVRRGSRPPGSAPPVTYGGGLSSLPSAPEVATTTTGILAVRVLDDAARPLAGAFVRYRGPSNGQRATDARGEMRVSVKPGKYVADIPPCGQTVVTKTYGAADLFVPVGDAAAGTIDGISWERRFRPTPSVTMSNRPPWKIGARVHLAVRIEDGCDFSAAPGVSLPWYAWTLSTNFAVTKKPVLRADTKGFAPIDVQCTAKGNGQIVIYDKQDAENRVDLLLAASAPPPGRSWCE